MSGDDGPGPWGWVAALGVLAVGGLAAFLWYRNQNEPPPDDLDGPDGDAAPMEPGDIQDVEPMGASTPPPPDTPPLGEPDEPPPPPAPTSSGDRPPG